MATRSHDMAHGSLGMVGRGAADVSDLVPLANTGIGCGMNADAAALQQSVVFNKPSDMVEGNVNAAEECRADGSRTITKATVCMPAVEPLDLLSIKLDSMRIGVPRASRNGQPESDTESLVERNWSSGMSKAPPQGTASRFSFEPLKVMSFNCLARSLVDNKYVNNDSEVMSWNSRKFAILDVVRDSLADVVCLQEVDEAEYENFFSGEFQRLGYRSVFKKKKSPKLDGVCILYQEERFEVLSHKDIEFAVDDANYDRLQVAIVLALVDKRSKLVDDEQAKVKDIYIFSNTHLLFNKNRGDIKFAQLCALLLAIKDMESVCMEHLGAAACNHPKPAIIMCGDFNFTPQSLLYHFLSKGYVVLRNCNVRLISGQYLMFDTMYKTEQGGHGKSGITVGNFEGNYISDIYGTGTEGEWVEPLSRTTGIDMFTKMPEWIKFDEGMHGVISKYLGAVNERSLSGKEDESSVTPRSKDADDVDKTLGGEARDLLFCPFKFHSAYSTFDPGQNQCNEPAFTAFHGWQRGCVDYIWYTADELNVQSLYEMPAYRDVKANGNLPNKGWPSSDHFSLLSEFKRRSMVPLVWIVDVRQGEDVVVDFLEWPSPVFDHPADEQDDEECN
ncbi:endonuclease/exonuclease/phosphatase family domain containing protein, putative [Babesia bigemina]|uniref:Endonuclease/exonuclease/phosphatase family domain containing protein, putative n=1 Tax=Babesia bigemina TaxID=5866 RepID=A0A061D6H9_BABBI|nr:endonuclease/exonuclease/phosphatase family domain containing protein, putative [Babesia bigemina]CDR95622.1 endonuclease/exonuclease/phosphatase family domain containing protein, putative [Babesia bigemina]|eukprot:XP_012767808.1 endonuclease/exonuclease/phosphatase family domain containing protein, putative [Babesia bigemina]